MTLELTAKLRGLLKHRAERLAKLAAMPYCPEVVIALTAEQVLATVLLLAKDDFDKRLFDRIMVRLRGTEGICICGQAERLTDDALCSSCIAEAEAIDKEVDAQVAMERSTKGLPS